MSFSEPVKLPMLSLSELTDDQKQQILKASQIATIAVASGRELTGEWADVLGDLRDQHVFGLFTTLARGKQLRGCCGFLGRPTPLSEAILQSAEKTVKEDYRMPAISPAELPYLTLDLSILGNPIQLDTAPEERLQGVEIGRHGLRITRGANVGILLPNVASEEELDVKQFLEAVCLKAGMHQAAWQDSNANLEVFDGIVISAPIDQELLPSRPAIVLPPGTIEQLVRLKQIVASNLIALTQGGTPSYVALDALDGNVNGIVLTLRDADKDTVLANWIHTSLRPGVPLQNSLFELTKSAADALMRTRFENGVNVEPEVTILFDPILHGTINHDDWNGDELKESLAHCQLDEIQPSQRAIVALAADRCGVSFNSERSVAEIVRDAARPVRIRRNPIAIFSMQCMSTCSTLLASNAPATVDRDDERKPAVANTFYPAAKEARITMLEGLQKPPAKEPRSVLGAMVPHAGIGFSGAVALKVWEQVSPSQTLLFIGPKHTPHGADWAISPSKSWTISEGEPWLVDTELSRQLASSVDGLVLDSNAHVLEHAIEVQLPILEFLLGDKPRPRIASIAMHGASWPEVELFSKQLAESLAKCEELPTIVISSDMNHFQPVQENLRRDLLALAALETGDAKHLLETCRVHHISMCGVVPAAIAIQTWKELGKDFKMERVAYESSANRGGDPNRVIGYAGLLFAEKA